MIDYNKGKIYKIIDCSTGNVYFGSTTKDTLAQRLSGHVSDYKRYTNGKMKKKVSSFKIIENGNYYIVLVELYPCGSKDQLTSRERFYIENYKCVNKVIPGRTRKEYRVENKERERLYRVENKQRRQEYRELYDEKNKIYIKERRRLYRIENSQKIKEKRRLYRIENKQKINEYKRNNYNFKTSWGGNIRTHNNLLCIDPFLFT